MRIALWYAAFGVVWILVSDLWLHGVVTEVDTLVRMETLKGWLFVALSSLFVYLLASRASRLWRLDQARLERSRDELQAAQSLAQIGYWTRDSATGSFSQSRALCAILGLDPEAVRERDEDLVARADRDGHAKKAREALIREGTGFDLVYPIYRPTGEARWIHETATTLPGASATKMMGAVRDVTDFQTTHNLLTRTFASIDEAVFIVRDRVILDCNPAASRVFGYRREELVGASTNMLHENPERFREFARRTEPVLKAGGVCHVGFQMRKKGGQTFSSEHTVTLLDPAQGVDGGVVSVVRDITDRARAEEAMTRYYRTLQAAREEERTRIAREVHDELGQALAGIKWDLSRLRGNDSLGGEESERIARMDQLLSHTLGTVRRIASELRPGVLDKLGLLPALEWLCEDFERRSGIPCAFHASEESLPISESRATHVFRIAQEALTNVGRHAQASRAHVRLIREGESAVLLVEDDGVGFDTRQDPQPSGLGLVGIRERGALIGGTVGVNSRVDTGTSIRVEFPLAVED